MAFSEVFLQELKLRNDITEVVSSYVSLKRRGRNMVGLCPFHGEKTPSFNIYTENGSFYCFGCGVGGDVISFIMKIENLDYVEAVRYLAQRAGIEVPDSYSADDSLSRLRKRIFEANREAARFFYSTLISANGAQGLDYLRGRMLSDKTIKRFGLGFADETRWSLSDYLKSKGFSDNELVSANLSVRRRDGKGIYDRFSNRVMFPIMDLRGNVIAFGGRIMTDEKPKYLNTSDTPVFKKSENLFSLNNAKNSGEKFFLLCEGYMDVIAVNQAGLTNAVATLGTALTSEQAMLLKRYTDDVVICYDSDEAGQKATSRAIPILRKAGINVRVLSIPSGKDPDEFIKSKGPDGPAAFRALVEKSGNDVEYRLQKLRQGYDLGRSEDVVKYLEEAVKIISALSSPIEQDVYISKICSEFGVEKSSFKAQVSRYSRRRGYEAQKNEQRRLQTNLSGRTDRLDTTRHTAPRSSSAEEAVVAYLIRNPDSAKKMSERLTPNQFKNPLMRMYYEYTQKRIADGLDPMSNATADFTDEERSRLYGIIAKYSSVGQTEQALEEYINTIEDEGARLSTQEVESSTPEQLMDNLAKLRKNKK